MTLLKYITIKVPKNVNIRLLIAFLLSIATNIIVQATIIGDFVLGMVTMFLWFLFLETAHENGEIQ